MPPLSQRMLDQTGAEDFACEPATQTIRDLLREGISILSQAGIVNAGQEARWLLEYALGMNRLKLQLDAQRSVDWNTGDYARSLFRRRAAREPLQYILGTQEFCGLEFEVGPAVLIPRAETELLVEEVLRLRLPSSAQDSPAILADIGTGCGCIAVSLAHALPHARIVATDCAAAALGIARQNAARHQVADRITFLEGDSLEPLRALGLEGKLAAVVSNPPYISDQEYSELPVEVRACEPRLALAGGEDGLLVHGRLIQEAGVFLLPGGSLVLEVGWKQAASVRQLALHVGGYGRIRIKRDPAGIERVVCLERM
ncbi:MAG: peptide chain release factor N(5)-glutamine methyltransferase, partial [Nitrospiraceae bacterium]